MKKNLLFMLIAMLSMVLCCCNNKTKECIDCNVLGVTIPAFEKKFPEKKVTLDPDYIEEGKTFVLTFSSMEEAEYKIVHCVIDHTEPKYTYVAASYDLTKKVILSDTSSFSYPFDTLMDGESFTIIDSDDGQVRCYGWHHIDGSSGYNPELMVQYKGEGGKIYTVHKDDFERGRPIAPEDKYSIYPEKIFRFDNGNENYTIIWGYYGFASGIASYGLIAFKMDEKGVNPVPLFQEDELSENIDVHFNYSDFDEDEFDLIRYDKDELAFYLPEVITEEEYYNTILSGRYKKYVWDGEAFALLSRDDEDVKQLIINSIANGDKETFAELVHYPLLRQYPLRNIYTKDEMIKYFDFLFDDGFRKTIGSIKLDEWHGVGWRGFTLLSGELWEDGGELVAVNYSSLAEQKLRDSLIKAEFDALHPSLQGDRTPIDRLNLADDMFDFARIDKSTVSDTLYRLSLFAKNAEIGDKPIACLNGYAQYEGNMGDGYFYFKSQDTVASYSFGREHEEGVPVDTWNYLHWMDKSIPCRSHYYQINNDF